MNPNTTIMLQSKDINKIAELKNGFTPRWLEPDFILSSLKSFSFSAVCKCLAPLKQRGYSFELIFSCLISLVLDDSFLLKTGRYIEKISRMFDHVSKQFLLGYKLLVMGYWDGGVFLPLDFSLHREMERNKDKPFGLKKKEYRKQI